MANPVEILFGASPKTKIGLVTLDAAVEIRHKRANEITKHPVEQGSDVSDHIRHTPDSVEITGMITNTPLVFLASLNASSPVADDTTLVADRAARADREFRRAMDDGDLLTVVTTLHIYKNMVITDYSVVKDKDSGNILDFTIGLDEVIIVQTQTVAAPVPRNASSGPVSDLGKAGTAKTTPAQDRSLLDIATDHGNNPKGVMDVTRNLVHP